MSTAPLIVVQPVPATDTMLTACTVPEADHPAWASGTAYAVGERVILTTGVHRVYQSLISGNAGNPPASSPAAWVEVGPTNRWACLDTSNSTATTAPSGAMGYTLRQVGAINAFAALNVRGAISIRVQLQHPTLGTIYDRTSGLASLPPASGWWSWWWGTRTAPPVLVLTDLPGIPGCDLVVDIFGTTELSVGVLLWGSQRAVGQGVLQGARVGITDYSRKETDSFGNTDLVQRAYAKRATWQMPVLASQVDDAADYLASLRAIPALWIGSSRYGSSVIYGFYKSFEITIAYATVSECSLDIEGLT